MLKWDQLGEKGGSNCPPKGPQTQLAPEGWVVINYDDDDDDNDDDFDDDRDDYDVFS